MDPSAYRYVSSSYGKNHYLIDRPLQAILEHFLGKVPDLAALGAFAGSELYETADYVDKVSNPKLITWAVDGERVDEIWLAAAERDALRKLFRDYGVNRFPYRGGTWLEHYAALYLVSDPGIGCILTVTNQTAYAIYKYGDARQREVLPSLIGETDPVRFGATWFTELQGGSDLGANLVEATELEDAWSIEGDTKYFASNAGLADYALVTARPKGAPAGAKGLELFLVPKLGSSGKRNYVVRRLKEKSATTSVPTGEVEFRGSEASLIGGRGKGIYYTMENLMVSRLANSASALGIARKAFLEAYYYAKKRRAFGKTLIEHPLVQRDLLDMEVQLEGALALTFKAVDQFQKSWSEAPPYTEAYHYARLLTHIAKNITAGVASRVTQTAMELHGGLGFLSEFPVERLHREALIMPIWEGPSNIQALDMLESMAKKGAHLALLKDADAMVERLNGDELARLAARRMKEALDRLSSLDEAEAQFYAKDALDVLGHAVASIVLVSVGARDHANRFAEIAKLYIRCILEGGSYPLEVVPTALELVKFD
jgi:alkylation response protein AidB-like acyl-CoA dehydrogenase